MKSLRISAFDHLNNGTGKVSSLYKTLWILLQTRMTAKTSSFLFPAQRPAELQTPGRDRDSERRNGTCNPFLLRGSTTQNCDPAPAPGNFYQPRLLILGNFDLENDEASLAKISGLLVLFMTMESLHSYPGNSFLSLAFFNLIH